jgi:hypothetical protein
VFIHKTFYAFPSIGFFFFFFYSKSLLIIFIDDDQNNPINVFLGLLTFLCIISISFCSFQAYQTFFTRPFSTTLIVIIKVQGANLFHYEKSHHQNHTTLQLKLKKNHIQLLCNYPLKKYGINK